MSNAGSYWLAHARAEKDSIQGAEKAWRQRAALMDGERARALTALQRTHILTMHPTAWQQKSYVVTYCTRRLAEASEAFAMVRAFDALK